MVALGPFAAPAAPHPDMFPFDLLRAFAQRHRRDAFSVIRVAQLHLRAIKGKCDTVSAASVHIHWRTPVRCTHLLLSLFIHLARGVTILLVRVIFCCFWGEKWDFDLACV